MVSLTYKYIEFNARLFSLSKPDKSQYSLLDKNCELGKVCEQRPCLSAEQLQEIPGIQEVHGTGHASQHL